MKQAFIETNSRKKAWDEYSWGSKVVKVCGGYLCFESLADYVVWANQK